MNIYKLVRSVDGEVNVVIRNGKDSIPFDPANTDYQEYLRWLESGNTPEPADQGEQ